MELRRQLITAQVGLVVVIAATAVMTIVAFSSTTRRSGEAYHQVTRDLKLRDHVRRSAELLADATRRYLVDGADVQRSRLAQLQRELDPTVDRLAARAIELGAPNRDSLEREIDGHVAWLSAVAAENVAQNEFERALESRNTDLEKQLKLFGEAAEEQGANTIARADRLARRAQLGVLFTSGIGIAMGLVLGLMALRKIAS